MYTCAGLKFKVLLPCLPRSAEMKVCVTIPELNFHILNTLYLYIYPYSIFVIFPLLSVYFVKSIFLYLK